MDILDRKKIFFASSIFILYISFPSKNKNPVIFKHIYLWLCYVLLLGSLWLQQGGAGHSPAGAHGHLTVGASSVAEHGL